jgi:hypothetical protein
MFLMIFRQCTVSIYRNIVRLLSVRNIKTLIIAFNLSLGIFCIFFGVVIHYAHIDTTSDAISMLFATEG